MTTVLVVVGACLIAALVSYMLQRPRSDDAPTSAVTHSAPSQLDRHDFENSGVEWLVVLFGSSTCHSCADMKAKVVALESSSVAVQVVDEVEQARLHKRYKITGVPIVVIADARGVVRDSFVGPVSSTHLWGAVAELRDPGSLPPGCGTSH